jgi:hypothetical protein
MVLELVVVAGAEAAEVMQPRVVASDEPAPFVPPKRSAVLEAMLPGGEVLGNQLDPAAFQAEPERSTVVTLGRDDAGRLLLRSAASGTRDGYLCERGFGEVTLGEVGRRKVHSERNALAVDQYPTPCPLAPECLADASAPLFAGAKVPSMKASRPSSRAASSRSLRKARHSESQTSAFSHSPSRCQQVAGAGYRSSMSRHRAPGRRIQRIPPMHARTSARGRPPFGFGTAFGSSREIRVHGRLLRPSGNSTPSRTGSGSSAPTGP